ncbi:MAG: hypothetical protein IJ306_08760 [Oscillospiraceae bacterium]|nr:hypothetical protein [Oscillospiraceae bacterium]
MARKKDTINIPMFIALVLLCLTLFSVHFSSGIFARYTTRANGGDSARTAAFAELSITETGDFDSGKAMLIPGVNLTKDATVSFGKAEVAVYVFVEVEVSDDWAINTENKKTFTMLGGKVSWSVAEGWDDITSVGGTGKATHVYYMEVAPNTEFVKDIVANEGAITVSTEITRNEMASLANGIFINFRATAVQSGGFASAEEAWNSVSAS